MRKLFVIFALLLAFVGTSNAQVEVGAVLKTATLDTLTGQASDSITAVISLELPKFNKHGAHCQAIVIIGEIVENINAGEGLNVQVEPGIAGGGDVIYYDTDQTLNALVSAPVAGTGFYHKVVTNAASGTIGNVVRLTFIQDASAADTDSLSYKYKVYGIFEN